MPDTITKPERRIAQATPYPDLALHTLGWKAFQDLCSEVCEVVLKRPVEIFREAQDGGQDAVFLSKDPKGTHSTTVQCKFSSKENERLQIGDLNEEFKSVAELVAASQASTYVIITNRRLDAPEQRVGDDVSDADDDIEPEDYFYELNQNLDLIQVALFGSAHSDSEQILEEIKALVDGGIEELQERKEEKKRKDEEDEWMMREWESRRLNKPSPPINPISTPVSSRGTRSIFSDVDE